MSRITHIHAREVFDSRGKPTIEVEVRCGAAKPGRAIVPSGASTGQFEALELRDTDDARLDGTGVRRALRNVTDIIAPAVIGQDATDQPAIDRTLCELDGTENKSRLGANAILGVSLAAAHAAAEAEGTTLVEHLHRLWTENSGPLAPRVDADSRSESATMSELGRLLLLPLPMVNMISGGLHAGGNLDFQDVLAIPLGAESYRQALEWIVTVYRRLGALLHDAGYEGRLVGDEGGYGPRLASNSQAVEFVIAAIEAARLRPGEDVAVGLDVAASHFFRDGAYHLTAAGGDRRMEPAEFVETLAEWAHKYPILSIEDGLADEDWDHWRTLCERLADRVQLIGDDLFATNPERLRHGIEQGVANSVLIKPNQIGTLTETMRTARLALDAGYWPVVSARSGETEDATIADLVVALGTGQIKIGAVARSERLAKYNQLLRLEEQLGDAAGYLGGSIFAGLNR